MRRQRNIFPRAVDLNQDPSFNGLDMTDSDECNSSLFPAERCLSSNDLSSELNKSQTFSSWDVGESSSRQNAQNHGVNSRSTSFGVGDSRIRERQFDHQRVVGTPSFLNSGSNHVPMDVVMNGGNSCNDSGPGSADMEASSSGTSSLVGNSRLLRNPESSRGYFDRRSTDSRQQSTQQPPLPGMARNRLPLPWNGHVNSRNGIGTSSTSGDNRNLVQDSANWSVATERNNTIRIPDLNSTTHDDERLNDLPPWTHFPSSETESGGHRRRFRHLDSNVVSSGGRNQPRRHQPILRSSEVPDEEWRPLGVDRRMLVSEMRQILQALRRGENLRAEDYMLFDPFITGVADLHDRHQNMRLDVDNMSYEELLALEERIGDVKTGLTEDVILKSMKQRKHFSFMTVSTQDFEPCCICQEVYGNGDDIGSLDCGHAFHTCCIKQWLTQKNLCPICKMTGLST